MLTIITTASESKKYQNKLESIIKKHLNQTTSKDIGFQGDTLYDVTVYYNNNIGLWVYFHPENNRYWNAFGISNELASKSLNIIVEVNIPYDFNRRVQGIFLSDDNGKIYLGHRGRINPYKRESFLNLYNGIIEIVNDGGETTPAVIIADLDNPNFINLLAEFVFEVAAIKKTLKESPFTNIEATHLPTFISENESRTDYTLNHKIEAHLPHAQVTNQLSKLFYNKGFHVSNTQYIDLLIGKDNKPTHIFEVKSKYDSQTIYTAIGQLFLHSLDFNNIIKKVLVLPNGYSTELKQKLDNLGIDIVEFKIIDNNVTFYNIDKICI